LIDEETAIEDIVKDYTTGGSNLIRGYEKERQKGADTNGAKVEHLRHNLIAAFKKAQGNQAQISKEMNKRRTKDLEAQWNAQQEGLMAAAKAALADCVDL